MVTSGSTDLATVSAVFFAAEGVDDLEVFEVVAGVGAEGQFHAVEFLDAHEQIGVFAAEAFEDARVDEDADLLVRMEKLFGVKLAFRADLNYHVENFKIINAITGEEYR